MNSVIVGGLFGDELRGAAGADTLFGGYGDDVLSGGAGSGAPATFIQTSIGSTVTVVGDHIQYDRTTSATLAAFAPQPVTIFVDSFSYTITDGHGNFSTASVSVSIMGI